MILSNTSQDRKLLWKLDCKLIPWLSFLYLISFLDRTNIGNAKVDGLQEDLKMTNGQYNASLTIFFVSYSVFEPLTNVLLKRLRPSVFLPIIMLWWCVHIHGPNSCRRHTDCFQGYLHDMHGSCSQLRGSHDCCKSASIQLIVCTHANTAPQRWWLGVAEAGLFPGGMCTSFPCLDCI
jgi:hypothetical protein